MYQQPEIAIIEPNTLCGIGLCTLLERMMPMAVVRTFNSFEAFLCDTPDMYVHYFIAQQVLLEHSAFFIERKHKTIVLTQSITGTPQLSGFHTLNIGQEEHTMVRSLLYLQQGAHAHGKNLPKMEDKTATTMCEPNGLSQREIEVLSLLAKGASNKEIADRLSISITTVISHRKNIVEKLGMRTVSGLTIYAVINGYVNIDEI